MPNENTKITLLSLFVVLVISAAGAGGYYYGEKQDSSEDLIPLVLGSWVKVPGICEGKTHYNEMVEILSTESIKVKGELINIVDFSISTTLPVSINCEAIGKGKADVQTSFMAGRFSRYYVGKIGKYTVMKNVSPSGELWFKLDTHFQQKLQTMSDIQNRRRL